MQQRVKEYDNMNNMNNKDRKLFAKALKKTQDHIKLAAQYYELQNDHEYLEFEELLGKKIKAYLETVYKEKE